MPPRLNPDNLTNVYMVRQREDGTEERIQLDTTNMEITLTYDNDNYETYTDLRSQTTYIRPAEIHTVTAPQIEFPQTVTVADFRDAFQGFQEGTISFEWPPITKMDDLDANEDTQEPLDTSAMDEFFNSLKVREN